MSLEEKAGQLSIFGDPVRFDGPPINPTSDQTSTKDKLYDDIAHGRLTGLFNGIGVTGAREMQKIAVEQAPNKIPLIFAADVIHGLKTIMPIPLGEAASWDTDLAMRSSRAAALEATAKGLHWTFAPMVDVARDERWGRTAETAGEDTYLDIQIAQARVKGFQGSDLKANDTVLACPQALRGLWRRPGRYGIQHRRHPRNDAARNPLAAVQGRLRRGCFVDHVELQ